MANQDSGQPYRDIKKLEEGNGVGSMKEGGCVGEAEHLFGKLGSDRALI